jgi:catabolite regulation protein CreA
MPLHRSGAGRREGVARGASLKEVSDISLACRQIGPIRFKAKFEQGEERFSEAALALFQEDANCPRL